MTQRYILDDQDRDLLRAATALLKKVAAAELLRPAELVSIAKLQHVLAALPRVTPDIEVSVQVIGPRSNFGEIETWHYWEVAVEGERLSISSGGHFYRPSTGGDSFTTMTWEAIPEENSELDDYRESLWMVPDVQSFPVGVVGIDFACGGYKIEVTDEDNPLLEVAEDDENGEDAEPDLEPEEKGAAKVEEAADDEDEPVIQQRLFSPEIERSNPIELYRRDQMIEIAEKDWHTALLIFREMGWEPARPLEAYAHPLTFIKHNEGEAMQRAGRSLLVRVQDESLLSLMRNEPVASPPVQMDLELFYRLTEFVGGGAFIVGQPGSYEDARTNDF